MRKLLLAALIGAVPVGTPTEAHRKPPVWSVDRTTDPITGVTRCTVAMLDSTKRMRFTRSGGLYPVVEMNSRLGLLIGVSSGGPIRIPTGDVVWRVDHKPHRTLKAQDNPVDGDAALSSTNIAVQNTNDAVAQMNRMAAAMTASSTMASDVTPVSSSTWN